MASATLTALAESRNSHNFWTRELGPNRAMIITADAESGRACPIRVQTAKNGEPIPTPGSTILSLG